jgi:hypothetical protein
MSDYCRADALVAGACETADKYLASAIQQIDQRLGEGAAKANPELVAGFMRAAALDFAAMWIAESVDALTASVQELRR